MIERTAATKPRVTDLEVIDAAGAAAARLREIDAALQRLRQPGYGHCQDCDCAIPFDRLTHQPQALRCVECQTEFEAAQAD